MRATAEVIRNLFLGHRAARLAVRRTSCGERRLVSANSYYLGLPTRFWRVPLPLMEWVDWRAGSEKGWAEEDWALVEGRIVLRPDLATPGRLRGSSTPAHPGPVAVAWLATLSERLAGLFGAARTFAALSSFTASNWWQLGMAGRLPEFLCPPECVGELDFVAFDYYFGTPYLGKVGTLLDVVERRYDRAPIWPGGLSDALRYFAAMFPGRPILVVENGFAGPPTSVQRARNLRRHLREVQAALAERLPVIGYLAWSLTTHREWGLPAGPGSDFGLFHIDLDADPELRRLPTPTGAAYAQIVRARRA